MTIKVEDNAPVGQRRNVTATFDIKVAFVPIDTNDPEVKTELELTFPDLDYDTVVAGNEANFIATLNATLSAKNPGVIFVHFELRKGSVIATFDMITQQTKKEDVLNQIAQEVNSEQGLTLNFQGTPYTSKGIKVENNTYTVSQNDGGKDTTNTSNMVSQHNRYRYSTPYKLFLTQDFVFSVPRSHLLSKRRFSKSFIMLFFFQTVVTCHCRYGCWNTISGWRSCSNYRRLSSIQEEKPKTLL